MLNIAASHAANIAAPFHSSFFNLPSIYSLSDRNATVFLGPNYLKWQFGRGAPTW
jgi:hypothetical protein